jgi:hypothetical protein
MGWRWTLLALLCGGCSQVFGLDPPVAVPDDVNEIIDTDGDGIADVADNCPMVKNADQTDTDRNEVGDVCEGCMTLPLRATDDDDGDMIKDNLDNCFGMPGNQTDADGDGIGIACDPRIGTDARFCVWTFRDAAAGEDSAVWTSAWQVSGAYEIKNSALTHTSSQQLETAILRAAPFESTTGIAFDTHILVKTFTPPVIFGLGFEQQQTMGASLYMCQVVQTTTMAQGEVQIVKDGAVVTTQGLPISLPMDLGAYARLSAINVGGNLEVSCTMSPDQPSGGYTIKYQDVTQPVKFKPRIAVDRANIDIDHVALYKLDVGT